LRLRFFPVLSRARGRSVIMPLVPGFAEVDSEGAGKECTRLRRAS